MREPSSSKTFEQLPAARTGKCKHSCNFCSFAISKPYKLLDSVNRLKRYWVLD
jgi:hypothetical protein